MKQIISNQHFNSKSSPRVELLVTCMAANEEFKIKDLKDISPATKQNWSIPLCFE